MEEVGHEVLRDRAVALDELVREVEPQDVLAVGVGLDERVDGGVVAALRVVGPLAAREDGEEEDLRLGLLRADVRKERPDAARGVLRLVAVVVVRADHEHDELRAVAGEFAVPHAPDVVLHAVAADAEGEDAVGLAQLREDVPPVALPAGGDRVAEEDEVVLGRPLGNRAAVALEGVEPHLGIPPPAFALEADEGGRAGGGGKIRLRRFRGGGGRGRTGTRRVARAGVFDERQDAGGPRFVAGGGGMEAVGERLGGQGAVRREEAGREVAPENRLAVRELPDLAVHHVVAHAAGVLGRCAAREDGAEDDLRAGLLRADLVEHRAHADDRVGGRLLLEGPVPRVVRADHQDDRLRLVTVEFAVVEPPQDVFRAVRAVAEVERVVGRAGEVLLPLRAPVALPEVRDRVADEDDARTARLHALQLLRVALHPPAVRVRVLRHGRDRTNVRPGDGRNGKGQHQNQFLHFLTLLQ